MFDCRDCGALLKCFNWRASNFDNVITIHFDNRESQMRAFIIYLFFVFVSFRFTVKSHRAILISCMKPHRKKKIKQIFHCITHEVALFSMKLRCVLVFCFIVGLPLAHSGFYFARCLQYFATFFLLFISVAYVYGARLPDHKTAFNMHG